MDEFFSPEALRLLEGGLEFLGPPFEETPSFDFDETPILSHNEESSAKREGKATSSSVPGCSTFRITNYGEPNPKRRKFDSKRRQEVASVLKQGACFSCRIRKVSVSCIFRTTAHMFEPHYSSSHQCSGILPCESCKRSQSSCHYRESKYRWMHCIPFSLKDLDIFAIGGFCLVYRCSRLIELELPVSKERFTAILPTDDNFLTEMVRLIWGGKKSLGSLDNLSTARDFATWISNEPLHETETNNALVIRAKVISSAEFHEMIASTLGKGLGQNLRILAETSTLIWYWGLEFPAGYSMAKVAELRSYAGKQMLSYLERALSARSMEDAGLERLQSLFLVLAGVIRSIGFMESWQVPKVVSHFSQSRPNS